MVLHFPLVHRTFVALTYLTTVLVFLTSKRTKHTFNETVATRTHLNSTTTTSFITNLSTRSPTRSRRTLSRGGYWNFLTFTYETLYVGSKLTKAKSTTIFSTNLSTRSARFLTLTCAAPPAVWPESKLTINITARMTPSWGGPFLTFTYLTSVFVFLESILTIHRTVRRTLSRGGYRYFSFLTLTYVTPVFVFLKSKRAVHTTVRRTLSWSSCWSVLTLTFNVT